MSEFPAVQFRAARPTRDLKRIVAFYRDGLGLPVIGEFHDHAGFSGVMFGLPDARAHLEFTEGPHAPHTPHPEENFVFYVPDAARADAMVARLAAMGHGAVTPANPYWARGGTTIADPDGLRVVVMRSAGFSGR